MTTGGKVLHAKMRSAKFGIQDGVSLKKILTFVLLASGFETLTTRGSWSNMGE